MENKKYELTKPGRKIFGVTYFQIRALRDFGQVKKGDLGGLIENEINLSHDGNSWIFGDAFVSGCVRISGNARVFGPTRLKIVKH